MSKGLEAIKHIVEIVDFYTKKKKYYDMRFFPQCDEALWLITIEKELKVLEIILNCVPLNIIRDYLEKEEKDLLKEVLNA